MAEIYNFRGDEERVPDCMLPPPDFGCVDTCQPCDNPCEDKCPPKVRAKDAVCLSDDEYQRCFSIYQRIGCEPVRVPAFIYCIELRVRRQGLCRVLTKECPIRADNQGNACFVWTDKFRDLPAGYYEADLYINGKSCFTWLFRKRRCWAKMNTESVSLQELPCEAPSTCCGGCVPQQDLTTDTRLGDCSNEPECS